MLDVVCGRQVHHVWLPLFQELDASGEDKLRQVGRVNLWHRHAEPVAGFVDAVFRLGGVAGAFRGERNRAVFVELEAIAEQCPQLVFGGDNGDPRTRFVEFGEHRRRAQETHIVHHHFLARVRVVKKVAADAVHRRRTACGDAHVVGIGETWDHRMRQAVSAGFADALERGHQSFGDGDFEVFRFAPVKADGNRAGLWRRVSAVIGDHVFRYRHVWSFRQRVSCVLPKQRRAGPRC